MKIDQTKMTWLAYIEAWRGDPGAGWFAFVWNHRRRPVRA